MGSAQSAVARRLLLSPNGDQTEPVEVAWPATLKHKDGDRVGDVALFDDKLGFVPRNRNDDAVFELALSKIRAVDVANCIKLAGGKFVWGTLLIVDDVDGNKVVLAVKKNDECRAKILEAVAEATRPMQALSKDFEKEDFRQRIISQ